ncbi:MAG TPA: dihydroorotate dehydrogenase-like protein [Prolixibacteraceae bacterium]|nr:dihydroorotate dehydrogenase-like protein [Prolixibacteraceae bacterium]
MADLSTSFMGIHLQSPVILGASNLVSDLSQIKKAEEAGIGAIVYKTLFEEQIQLETLQLDEALHEYDHRAAEMEKLFPEIEHAGPEEHLIQVRKLKENVSVPVFASLNAIYNPTWVEYARLLEQTGVDGLEVNFYRVPVSGEADALEIENHQIHILKEIKEVIRIPVSVKISPFYTNPLHFAEKLDKAGMNGLVLFNRFFQPEIDIENEAFHFPWELTQKGEYKVTLRYVGLLYQHIKAEMAATRGVKTYDEVIKMILAGAHAVQMVSAFYENSFEHLRLVLSGLQTWMSKKGYQNLSDFRGKLSHHSLRDEFTYSRAQYVDILKHADDILKKYPMR